MEVQQILVALCCLAILMFIFRSESVEALNQAIENFVRNFRGALRRQCIPHLRMAAVYFAAVVSKALPSRARQQAVSGRHAKLNANTSIRMVSDHEWILSSLQRSSMQEVPDGLKTIYRGR